MNAAFAENNENNNLLVRAEWERLRCELADRLLR